MSWQEWQELLEDLTPEPGPVVVVPIQIDLFEENPGGALGVSLNTEIVRKAVEDSIAKGDIK